MSIYGDVYGGGSSGGGGGGGSGGPSASRALVRFTIPEAVANGSVQSVDWDAAVYDIGGWFDQPTNPSRLTVPTGISKIRVGTGLSYILMPITADCFANIRKNNAPEWHGVPQMSGSNDVFTNGSGVMWSPWVDVVPGDYFEVWVQHTHTTAEALDQDRSWFAIEGA
ncbi:MAG: hypothetical protein V3R84_07705 [Acidimicrobiia bacterium]